MADATTAPSTCAARRCSFSNLVRTDVGGASRRRGGAPRRGDADLLGEVGSARGATADGGRREAAVAPSGRIGPSPCGKLAARQVESSPAQSRSTIWADGRVACRAPEGNWWGHLRAPDLPMRRASQPRRRKLRVSAWEHGARGRAVPRPGRLGQESSPDSSGWHDAGVTVEYPVCLEPAAVGGGSEARRPGRRRRAPRPGRAGCGVAGFAGGDVVGPAALPVDIAVPEDRVADEASSEPPWR